MQKTPLHSAHQSLSAHLVPFAGWEMPLKYGSQIEEHQAVRQSAGMFDVSHMGVVECVGTGARDFLRRVLANDVAKLKKPGKALYTCMLNPEGGIIDDLIVYWRAEDSYRIIVNAAMRTSDLAWLEKQAQDYAVTLTPEYDWTIVAVQGPKARGLVASMQPALQDDINTLRPFEFVQDDALIMARTGYTGEDGIELIGPSALGLAWWDRLLGEGVVPVGLAARDTLRLEAGLNLYGQDMDTTVTPFESNLAWTVSLKDAARDFIGRQALEAQQAAGVPTQLVGLVSAERAVFRHGMTVDTPQGTGVITSGVFSPSLSCTIAMARIPTSEVQTVSVQVRQKTVEANIVSLPFIKQGQATFELKQAVKE